MEVAVMEEIRMESQAEVSFRSKLLKEGKIEKCLGNLREEARGMLQLLNERDLKSPALIGLVEDAIKSVTAQFLEYKKALSTR